MYMSFERRQFNQGVYGLCDMTYECAEYILNALRCTEPEETIERVEKKLEFVANVYVFYLLEQEFVKCFGNYKRGELIRWAALDEMWYRSALFGKKIGEMYGESYQDFELLKLRSGGINEEFLREFASHCRQTVISKGLVSDAGEEQQMYIGNALSMVYEMIVEDMPKLFKRQ